MKGELRRGIDSSRRDTQRRRVPVGRFIAAQLRRPSGVFGRLLTARLLNRVNAPMNRLTLAQLALAPDDHVLEVGFGGGDLIARMTDVVRTGRVAGVDFSPEMVALCTRRFAVHVAAGRVALHCAGAERLPYDADAFTKACSVNTIYFWSDPALALGELRRTLRPGGRLVLAFNPRATAEKLPYTRHGFRLYEGVEVTRLLEDAGFRDVRLVAGAQRLGEFLCAVAAK